MSALPRKTQDNVKNPAVHKKKEVAGMKYLIASDIHGSAYYCRKLLTVFDRVKADRLILLGDILYHGPRNDLPKDYAPKEVAALLNERKDIILAVRGNCEAEVDQMMLEFPVMAEYAALQIPDPMAPKGERLIYLTHGHKYNIDSPLPLPKGSVLVYGHTHIPIDEERNGIRYLNPGSVSIPKAGSSRGCLVYRDGEFLRIELEKE